MATLTITGRSDVASAAAGIDDLSASVRTLDDDVARVDDTARQSGAGLDTLADSSDAVASRSSQAAGGLGDLAGGLGAIGATGAAGALEGVAIAAQTAVGAGDILNLVAETTVGRYVAQTAASIAHRTATIAGAIATGAMTAAQTALNVVLAANPIALVVIAVVALTAGIILLYRNSETFREIVQRAFEIATLGIRTTIAVIEIVVGWFRDLGPIAREAWATVSEAVEDKIDDAKEFVEDLVDFVKDAPRDAAATVAGHFSTMFKPIETAIGWVEDLIQKIKDIDFPDFPDVPFFGRRAGDLGDLSVGADGQPTINLTLNASATPFDPEQWIEDLLTALREYAARRGYTLTLTETPA